jgi:hypothetical protein
MWGILHLFGSEMQNCSVLWCRDGALIALWGVSGWALSILMNERNLHVCSAKAQQEGLLLL